MNNNLGTATRNVTTTLLNINISELFGAGKVVVVSQDEDNNIYFQPNPNNPNVPTANEEVSPGGVVSADNIYQIADADISKFAVNDVIQIETAGGSIFDAKIKAVDSTSTVKTIEIYPVTGLQVDDTDKITVLCYKLPSNFPIVVRGSLFTSGFLVKHKDNTDTTKNQLVLIGADEFNNVKLSPFFFENGK